MAAVIWTIRAQSGKDRLYQEGRLQFGVAVAKRMALKIEEIQRKLQRYPTIGYPEPLLKTHIPLYRAWPINKRFKIVYRFDEPNDTVVIEDIWDTRRSPQNLTQRIKK